MRSQGKGRSKDERTDGEALEFSCSALTDALLLLQLLRAPKVVLEPFGQWLAAVKVLSLFLDKDDWEVASRFVQDDMPLLDALMSAPRLRQ